jgi:cell division protein FtsA
MYATGVGLVLYGARTGEKRRGFVGKDSNIFNRVLGRMKKWFKDII